MSAPTVPTLPATTRLDAALAADRRAAERRHAHGVTPIAELGVEHLRRRATDTSSSRPPATRVRLLGARRQTRSLFASSP